MVSTKDYGDDMNANEQRLVRDLRQRIETLETKLRTKDENTMNTPAGQMLKEQTGRLTTAADAYLIRQAAHGTEHAAAALNRACRFTPEELAWIYSYNVGRTIEDVK